MNSSRVPVNPTIERLAAYAWRFLVLAAAAALALWLIGVLWVVFLSLFIALLLTRVLSPGAQWLRDRGWSTVLAAATVLVGFLVVLGLTAGTLSVAVANQISDVGPTVSRAVDQVEDWLVNDAPGDISRADLARYRTEIGDSVSQSLRRSSGSLLSGAMVAFELMLSGLLALIITFFALKDGERFLQSGRGLFPEPRHDLVTRLGIRTWRTLGGYLKGAAILGVVEGIIIGVTLAIVGAELATVVGVITFLLAFVPFVGAIVAGVLAILVTLATAGGTAALVVLVVAVVVQQLDNELLAPVIYGQALQMHPVVVLLAIAGGGALFGVAGSLLAVPVTAVAVNLLAESRAGAPLAAEASPAPD